MLFRSILANTDEVKQGIDALRAVLASGDILQILTREIQKSLVTGDTEDAAKRADGANLFKQILSVMETRPTFQGKTAPLAEATAAYTGTPAAGAPRDETRRHAGAAQGVFDAAKGLEEAVSQDRNAGVSKLLDQIGRAHV